MITPTKPTTLRESALIYNSWGLSTIPVIHGSKKPLRDWKKNTYERMTKNEILSTWQGQENEPNIGLTGGLVSRNSAIFDFDSNEGLKEMMQDSIFREIRSNTFVSLSANKHLPHVNVKFSFPIQSTRINKLDLDVKATNGYVVSPLSCIHSNKQLLLYTFEKFQEPLQLNEEQENYLIKRLDLKRVPEENYYWYGLNHNGYKYVTTGDPTLVGKKDRSSADQKILYILIKNGKTKEDIKEFIHSHYYKDSKFFVLRNKPDYYFEHSYSRCLDFIQNEKIETNELIKGYQNKIYSLPNTTDQKVFSFLLNMSTWQGTTENFFASMRTISTHSGIALGTASKSVKRLIEDHKVIELQQIGTRNFLASSYKEPLASTYKILPIPENLQESDSFDNQNLEHDAFRHRGLGAKGKIVYDIIKSLEGCSLSELKKEAKLKGVHSKNTVKSKIRCMLTLEFIRIHENKFYANPLPDLERASEILGTKGTKERSILDYKRQRIGFRVNRF
jgi:hypothetical protein